MERHIQRFLNKVLFVSFTVATLTLLFLFLQTPETCIAPNSPPKPHLRFPKSTCLFLYSILHPTLPNGSPKEPLQSPCVSAGAGHEVMALSKMGLEDVTGVELIESWPLVSRADPLDLPFFDGAFDVAFTGHLEEALYPTRYAGEMERTLRKGGLCGGCG
ncbi:hypothetical protein CRYUN_Cryun35bG0080600 [Craigia yunnanensis]